MFLQFYGLSEQPFGPTADSRFVYVGPSQREALASLYCGVTLDRSMLALVAPAGTGKTTLLRHLLNRLHASTRTIYLFQTLCGRDEFLEFFLGELGVEGPVTVSAIQRHAARLLADERRDGRRCLLAIDEAQNLPEETLEAVRLLTNLESQDGKLVQIILSGQPGLGEVLGRPALAALRQRIGIFARLSPLSIAGIREYIAHRLRVAGHSGPPLFTPNAIEALAEASGGVPRCIDNLCFGALSLSCALGRHLISREVIEEVSEDLGLAPGAPPSEDSPGLDPAAIPVTTSSQWSAQ